MSGLQSPKLETTGPGIPFAPAHVARLPGSRQGRPDVRVRDELSKARIDELRELLQRTTLASVITASRKVGDRLDFINVLNALLLGCASGRRPRRHPRP